MNTAYDLSPLKPIVQSDLDTLSREAKAKIEAGPGSWSPQKLSHQHDVLIDLLLLNPTMTQREAAKHIGRSYEWVCRVVNADAFKARMAARRDDLIAPELKQKLNKQMQRVVIQSLEVVGRKLSASDSAEVALEALGVANRYLGLGK